MSHCLYLYTVREHGGCSEIRVPTRAEGRLFGFCECVSMSRMPGAIFQIREEKGVSYRAPYGRGVLRLMAEQWLHYGQACKGPVANIRDKETLLVPATSFSIASACFW